MDVKGIWIEKDLNVIMEYELEAVFLYLPNASFHPPSKKRRWGFATPSGQWCFEVWSGQ